MLVYLEFFFFAWSDIEPDVGVSLFPVIWSDIEGAR